MFCQKCGSQIADAAVVCPQCGAPVAGRVNRASTEVVPNHMIGAVLSTLFCCQIGGIIAIIYASQVNTKLALGDIEGARSASKTASIWILVNVISFLALWFLYFLLVTIACGL